jgi:hypothetical protein
VVVTVVAVGMVQVAFHQVVDVIAVGNLVVAAVRAVAMTLLMPAAGVVGRAARGVRHRDLQSVVIDVVAMHVAQVAVVQVVRVVVVPDGDMAATRTVLVGMSLMHSTVLIAHRLTPL